MNDMQQFEQHMQKTTPEHGTLPFPDEETITWGQALQGLNPTGFGEGANWAPWENAFWRSFAGALRDSATGIPQLPTLVVGLAKELPKLPKLPGILKENFGEGEEFLKELEDAGLIIVAALMEDYMNRYGSLEGFKRALATDAFSILMDALPSAAALKGVKLAGRLGKVVRGVGKTASAIDKATNLPGEAMGFGVKKGLKGIKKQFAMGPESYNIPIDIQTGKFDESTGRPITRSITPRELAEELSQKSGTQIKPEDLPIQALTDNEIPITFEEVLRKTEAEIAPKIAAEYDAATDLVKGAQSELLGKYPTQFKKYWNPSSASKFLQEQYRKTQRGEKGRIGELFEKNKEDLDVAVQTGVPDTTIPALRQSLPRTEAYINELLEEYDGNIENVANRSTKAAIEEYYKVAETLSNIENLTYNTLRDLRTSYGDNVNLFAQEGKILKTGEGSIDKLIYNRITEDIFEQLEKAIEQNPDAFPEDMVTRVKAAHAEWRDWMDLEDSDAANWIREGSDLDKILSKGNKIVDVEVGNLKRLLGEEWPTFQKGLLNRLLENSMNADGVTPVGLKAQLQNVNSKNKYQLTQLFGEDTAKMLNDISEFRERVFGPKGKWNTPYAQELIEKYLRDPEFTNLLLATGMMSDASAQAISDAASKANKVVDVPGVQLAAAVNLIFAGALYLPKKIARNKLASGGYRKWMTQGYQGIKWRGININHKTMQDLHDLVEKHGWRTFYPGKVAARTMRQKKEREPKIRPPIHLGGRSIFEKPVE